MNSKERALHLLRITIAIMEASENTIKNFNREDDVMWSKIERQIVSLAIKVAKDIQECAAIIAEG